MAAADASFASPSANANLIFPISAPDGWAAFILNSLTWYNALLGALLFAVFYDQCMLFQWLEGSFITDLSTVSYIYQKANITGPAMKIPFMGPFLESVYPVFSRYEEKWASAELSCVSVFHK